MNLINIIIIASIATPTVMYSLGSNNPVLSINAIITTQDGTKTELNEVKINRNTEIYFYTKTTQQSESDGSHPIQLPFDPFHSKAGPRPLATIKSIRFINPKKTFVYEDEKIKIKREFREVEIDGTSYLMNKAGDIEGTDGNRVKRTINFDIVQSIEIMSACAKPEIPANFCPPCPAQNDLKKN
jgi:hypothetical protein